MTTHLTRSIKPEINPLSRLSFTLPFLPLVELARIGSRRGRSGFAALRYKVRF